MRELKAITEELATVASDIATKRKALEDAAAAQTKAFNEHDKAVNKAVSLRQELDESLNLLVPGSMQSNSRVRQSQ